MKNLSTSFCFVLLALATALSASAQTIRRVNNTGITGTNIYADLTAAHTAASNGDIIQVEPSTVAYAGFTCTKQLTIVGPGYFLGENAPPALQASTITAVVGSISFNAGSAGTSVAGIVGNTTWYIAASNITIQRCYLQGYVYVSYGPLTSNLVFRQNYITGELQEYSDSSYNILITNNVFVNAGATFASVGSTGVFSNNTIINGNVSLNAYTVRNNYFDLALTTTANTNWDYNIFKNATVPALGFKGPNNQVSKPQASVFAQTTGPGQYDGWYKLKTGTNPAVGTGEGSVDVGATGSATGYSYHFAGLPAIPAIYQLGQTVSGNTLNVTLGTRSNN